MSRGDGTSDMLAKLRWAGAQRRDARRRNLSRWTRAGATVWTGRSGWRRALLGASFIWRRWLQSLAAPGPAVTVAGTPLAQRVEIRRPHASLSVDTLNTWPLAGTNHDISRQARCRYRSAGAGAGVRRRQRHHPTRERGAGRELHPAVLHHQRALP